jgi:hypothetical protein
MWPEALERFKAAAEASLTQDEPSTRGDKTAKARPGQRRK